MKTKSYNWTELQKFQQSSKQLLEEINCNKRGNVQKHYKGKVVESGVTKEKEKCAVGAVVVMYNLMIKNDQSI